ncbi:hypothetical protein BJ878DRAFT_502801 [Calycina marina]|uniref:Uncharacterized protein n=1 Tax=Calycina marina TaxID=1763456 RepID=A0A9P7Z4I6_9HELO|nr:hypothetical protein BJ878DRAFT_502801 [Calycina marina]
MVVFIDLEEDNDSPESVSPHWSQIAQYGGREFGTLSRLGGLSLHGAEAETRSNPNMTAVAEALGAYPVIIAIVSHIDLNTLDALARTCRQIRANMLQYHDQLIASTLHCENECIESSPEHTFRYRAHAADWYFVDSGRDAHGVGKVGDCARDMVGGCRRCARIVCRNCIIKPPAPTLNCKRHRRLCKSCQKAPLSKLTAINVLPQCQGAMGISPMVVIEDSLQRAVCTCPTEGVWLCQPCGRNVRSADVDYEGIWKWRTRYLPSLGGLGVGIGEGDRGVECGLSGGCLAFREVEQETDCDAEDARDLETNSRAASPSSSLSSTTGSFASGQMGPGYTRHEIEGIGGRLKKKRVRMVKIGACVAEYEEERSGKLMAREAERKSRSWCGWCWRVVPCAKDLDK